MCIRDRLLSAAPNRRNVGAAALQERAGGHGLFWLGWGANWLTSAGGSNERVVVPTLGRHRRVLSLQRSQQ
eukprot:12063892-Alexandrium_andersonii.AAC.1